MNKYILKSDIDAEIEKLKEEYALCPTRNNYEDGLKEGRLIGYKDVLNKINTLEVKDPYEQCVQYPTIKDGIKAHAETYSFNIESMLFNQLPKEQQELWRKEIEQAYISGGNSGVEFARDHRYKENLEVKEVDLEKELETLDSLLYDLDGVAVKGTTSYLTVEDVKDIAKHFFELGLKTRKG